MAIIGWADSTTISLTPASDGALGEDTIRLVNKVLLYINGSII